MRLSLNNETNVYATCPLNIEAEIEFEEKVLIGDYPEESKQGEEGGEKLSNSLKHHSSILSALERKNSAQGVEAIVSQN
jgi:hypothetical protein